MKDLYAILLFTFLLSLLLEKLIQPKVPKIKRSLSSYILHFAIISFVYLNMLSIVQRPIFSSLHVLITQTIFILVSNAKYKALKEPLVFSDIVMFSQAFKYPRLYFPFLGWLPIIIIPTLVISAIVLVIYIETAIILNYPLLIVFIIVSLVGIYILALQPKHSLNIAQDIQRFGFINTLVSYYVLSQQKKHKQYITKILNHTDMNKHSLGVADVLHNNRQSNKKNLLQDVVVIQSESFFDARRLHPSVAKDVLKHFDRCCDEAHHSGRLDVAAWGANTMRTEFSFLSGIGFEKMGYYRFYPYYYMRHYQVDTLASYLQKIGYYCICIHPHHAEFFGRAGLFPQLGFDEFIDIAAFLEQDKYGPYISDDAVSKKIITLLKQKKMTNKPYFIFAITMENHGPLHLEQITAEHEKNYYTNTLTHPMPNARQELSVYLRHLKNADKMIDSLMTALSSDELNNDTLLCLYGDHVPSMPTIYAETGFNDQQTEYVIWSSTHNKKKHHNNNKEDISVQQLAEKIKSSLMSIH